MTKLKVLVIVIELRCVLQFNENESSHECEGEN